MLGMKSESAASKIATILEAIAALASNGLIARTAAGTVSARTITGTANQVTVANGDGVSGNPTLSLPTDFKVPSSFGLDGDITPAQITADQNDYNPTGLATAARMRINSDAYRAITGLQGGYDGRIVHIINTGSFQIAFADNDAGSSAANRFRTINNSWATLNPKQSAILIYDGTSGFWDVILGSQNVASQADAEAETNFYATVPPAYIHNSPGVAKCWGQTTGGGTPSLITSYNVTSITDTAVGRLTVTIGTDFSSANWSGNCNTVNATATLKMLGLVSKAAGSVILECGTAAATLADPGTGFDWQFFGDQ